jgi:hypothetical protein
MIPTFFRPIENLENLRKGHRILVGDNPDGRKANFYYNGRVDQHHRTQRRAKFPEGYLRLENGKYIDKKKRVLTDAFVGSPEKTVYVFRWSRELDLLFRKCEAKKRIRAWSKSAEPGERKALLQTISESGVPDIGRGIQIDSEVQKATLTFIEIIDLARLENIVRMLRAGQPKNALTRRIAVKA